MEKFRFNKKNVFTFGLIFVSLIVIYVLALYLTALLPSDRIKANIAKSAQLIEEQRDWEDPAFFFRWGPTSIDYGIDAYTMNIMYNIDSKAPFKSILLNKLQYVDTISSNDVSTFVSMIKGNAPKEYQYGRYWNGYMTVFRPMFLFYDYLDIRAINIFVFNLLAFLLIIFLVKKMGYFPAIAFALSLIYINFWCIPWSLQYVFVFYLVLISSLIIVISDIKKEVSYLKMFFIIGSLTIFLDNTTVPPITFAIPFIFLIVKKEKFLSQQSFKQVLLFFIRFGICWFLGYGLTLIMKPILLAVFNPDLSSGFIEHIVLRTSGKGGHADFSFKTIVDAALDRNFNALFFKLYPVQTIIITAFSFFSWLIFRKKGKFSSVFYLLVLISAIPILWCIVAAYHSYEHVMLNYRIFMISMLSLLLAYKNTIDMGKVKKMMRETPFIRKKIKQ